MKTMVFCNLFPNKTGAFEWLLRCQAEAFRQAGDELVLVFAAEPIAAVAETLRAAGARWRILTGWTTPDGREHAWRFVLPAARMVREERPEVAVVHFGNEVPCLCAAFLTKLFCRRRPRWVWPQEQQMRDPAMFSRHFSRIRLLALACDHFIAVYDGGRESLIKRGISGNRISVIYNGIRDHTPRAERGWLKRELELAEETLLAVSVGWLIRRKRFEFQLEAFSAISGQRSAVKGQETESAMSDCALTVDTQYSITPALHHCSAAFAQRSNTPILQHSFVLLIIGEGPERQRLEALSRELGLADRVRFLGLRNDVRDILAQADILLHSSRAETCTYVISEAMAAGIPAVVTEAGAAREQIENGVSGYVLARDDLDGFARRLAELAGDREKRRAMGQAARRRWEERYRVEKTSRQYHELYRSLAGR